MQNNLTIHCQILKHLNWQSAETSTFSNDTQIHFWFIKISHYTAEDVASLEHVLTDSEKAKAQRFRFEKDRKRYIITHSLLRQLLSKYLNIKPLDIEFGETGRHKPIVSFPETNLLFNISHSGDAIAIGVLNQERITSKNIDFGVDIELFKSSRDHRVIAKYYFSDRERFHLDQNDTDDLFYVYWTRKEALLKASGIGLLGDIQELEVAESSQQIPVKNKDWAVFSNKNYQVITFLIEKDLMGSIALAGYKMPHIKAMKVLPQKDQ